jgi:hypothetical protein
MPTTGDEVWGHGRPTARKAVRLGEADHDRTAMTRSQLFDQLDIDASDYRDGYSANALYFLYLDARHRALPSK